ncbi:Fe(3+) dicitrate ABC transporter substrate-binding protein [Marinomonas sp.]
MVRLAHFFLLSLSLLISSFASAVEVQDSKGTFTLDYTPQRIVVLEFSFADALASVGVSPIGIADDKDATRVLKEVRDVIGVWQSVGTRSQPSLETIASLKPDLIIADIERHESVYEELQKIAPTLILPSRRETYEDNLKAAAIIGKVLNKDHQMQERLAVHKKTMQSYKEQLPQSAQLQFTVARKDSLYLHTSDSYAGGVITALGLTQPELDLSDKKSSRQIGLEQLLAVNPEYLIVGEYVSPNIIDTWQSNPLFGLLRASQSQHIYAVDGNVWARCRGIMAAERMAQDLVALISH